MGLEHSPTSFSYVEGASYGVGMGGTAESSLSQPTVTNEMGMNNRGHMGYTGGGMNMHTHPNYYNNNGPQTVEEDNSLYTVADSDGVIQVSDVCV